MGGILILFAVLLPTLLWIEVGNIFAMVLIGSTLWLGVLGGVDDYLKIKRRQSKGLSIRSKLVWQGALGCSLQKEIQ